jgi:hypothetical protein
MVGHCLSGAGSVESVANFTVVPWFCFQINCEDLNPEITALIDESKIPSRNQNGFEYYCC